MAKKKKSSASAPADATEKAESGYGEKAEKGAASKGDGDLKDIHAEALKRYERGFNRDRHNIDLAYEDLRFAADDEESGGQWDAAIKRERNAEGRPVLTVNKIPQFVRQVTGDMRQMRPAIKVVPVDDDADKDVADKILPSMIRYIENRSDAQGIYFSGADSQVQSGIGHWRVITEYAHHGTLNQEVRVAPVDDQVAVVWDDDATLPTREDAMWCFVPVDISRATFEERYEDKSPDPLPEAPEAFNGWCSGDMVRISEYWCKEPYPRKLALLPDGSIEDVTDRDDDDDAMPLPPGTRYETREGCKICRYLISAGEVLEGPDEWPGSYIPVVPVLGEETKIGRVLHRRGVVRPLKDLARLYNYSISTQTECVALQPKMPFIGTHTHFEKNPEDWENANRATDPFIAYKPDPQAPGTKPERVQPAVASQGIAEILQLASADMNAVTGIYPASLGAQSNETSGKAIMARQREGDTGTIVYIDNFSRAVRHTGKIILDLIPHIYDTPRTIRMLGEDGKIDLMQINQTVIDPMGDGIVTKTLNDLTVGAYDVMIEMGPSYSTKREEARDGMQALMQALGPQSALLFTDLFAKVQDWPLADKIAKRAHLMLPPPIQMAEAQESGEPPPPQMPPPPPSPEQQMAMQKHQADMVGAQVQQQNDAARLQIDSRKLDVELQKLAAEVEKARLDHAATMAGHQATIAGHQASVAAAAAGAPPPAQPDPRVDDLSQTVDQMRDVLQQIVQALSAPQPPQPGPPPDLQPSPNQPPPGGFSNGAAPLVAP